MTGFGRIEDLFAVLADRFGAGVLGSDEFLTDGSVLIAEHYRSGVGRIIYAAHNAGKRRVVGRYHVLHFYAPDAVPARAVTCHMANEVQVQVAVFVKERRYVDDREALVALGEIGSCAEFVRIEKFVAFFV